MRALFLLLLPLCLLADSFYIQEKIELPTAYRNAEASLLLSDDAGASSHPCTLVRQGLEAWVIARLELDRSRTYKISLRLNQPGAEPHDIVIDPNRQLQVHRYDVALVMDCSDSMTENDPHDLRAAALAEFFDLAKNSKKIETISLIAFRTEAELLLKPTRPDDIPDPSVFIKKLKPRASTNFDKPLAMTLDALKRHGLGNQQALVFLSDGQPIRRYRDTHEDFTNTPIYTIGLSPEADGTLLSRIAKDTRGQFFDAPEPTDLSSIFTQIFHLIDQPGTILRQRMVADPSATLDFPVDPTMRNTTLKFAMIQGAGQVAIDNTPIPATDDLVFHPLPKLPVGNHRLSLTGPARMSAELLASTDVHLRLLQPYPSGDRGLPILTFGYVTYDAPLDAPPTITCELRSPDGTTAPMTIDRIGKTGVFRAAHAETRAAGPYTVVITARGSIEGQPFLRSSQLVYERTGRQLQAQTDDASIIQRERKPDTSTDVAPVALPEVPLTPAAGPLDVAAPTVALQTTFWASAPHLDFPTLYPGETHSESIDILINTTSPAPLTVGIPEDETSPIALTFEGKPHNNRRATITVTAIPRAPTATAWERPLELRLGDQTWTIPLRGSLAVPTIQVDTTNIAIDETPSEFVATSRLTVELIPQGTADLSITTDLEGLEINPPALVGRAAPQRVQLTFRIPKPVDQDSWQGTVTIAGDGLEPAQVPFRVDVAQDIVTDTAGPGYSGSSSSSGPGFPWWWLLLMLLLILLLALILASVRGNKRAAFILASLLIHAAILFLYIPKPEIEESADAPAATVTTMTVSTGEVMQEREIASEVAEFQSESDAPSESAAEMASADSPAESAEQAAQATLESEEAFERPEPEVQPEETTANVEREQMEVQELESQTQEIERKQETVDTTAEAAESQQSKETVETEAPAAESQALEATKTEAQVAESAAAASVQLEVEREEVTPENLQSETQEIERKQETVETAAAAAESQEQTKETVETEAPTAESQALEATKAEAQVAESAAASQVELEVQREEVTAEAIQSETQEIERKQETVEVTTAEAADSQSETKETAQAAESAAESTTVEVTAAEAAESAPAPEVTAPAAESVERREVSAEAIASQTEAVERKKAESAAAAAEAAAQSDPSAPESAQAAESAASAAATVNVTDARADAPAAAAAAKVPTDSGELRASNELAELSASTAEIARKQAQGESAAAEAQAAASGNAPAAQAAPSGSDGPSAEALSAEAVVADSAPAAGASPKGTPGKVARGSVSTEAIEQASDAPNRKQAQGQSSAADAPQSNASASLARSQATDGDAGESGAATVAVGGASAPSQASGELVGVEGVAREALAPSEVSGAPSQTPAKARADAPSQSTGPQGSESTAVTAQAAIGARSGQVQGRATAPSAIQSAVQSLAPSGSAPTAKVAPVSNTLSDLSGETTPVPRAKSATGGGNAPSAAPAASTGSAVAASNPDRAAGDAQAGADSIAPASANASPLSASDAARPATGPTSRPSNSLSDLASDSAAPTPRGSSQGQAQVADSAPAAASGSGPSSLAPRPSSNSGSGESSLNPSNASASPISASDAARPATGPTSRPSNSLSDLASDSAAPTPRGSAAQGDSQVADSAPAAASGSGPSSLAPRPSSNSGSGESSLSPSNASASPLSASDAARPATGPTSRPSNSLSDLASDSAAPTPRGSSQGQAQVADSAPAAASGSGPSSLAPRPSSNSGSGESSLNPSNASASPISASDAARPATGPTSRPSNSLSDLASDSAAPTPRGSAAQGDSQVADSAPAAASGSGPSSLAPRPSANSGSGESSLNPSNASASPLSASDAARPAAGPTSRPSNSLSDLASDSAAPSPRGSAQGEAQVADSAAPASGGASGPTSLAPSSSAGTPGPRMVEPGLSPAAGLSAATPSLRSPQRQGGPLSNALADLTSEFSQPGNPGRGQSSGPQSPSSGPAAASASGPSSLAPSPAADSGGGSQLAPSTGPMAPSASPLAGGGPRSDAVGPVARPSTSLSDLAGGPGSAQRAPRGGGGGQTPSDGPAGSGGAPLASGGGMATSPRGSEGEGPESRELELGSGPAGPISPASPLAGGPGSSSGPISRPAVGPSDLSGQGEPMARAPRRGGGGSGQTPGSSTGPVGAPAGGSGPVGLSGGLDGLGDIGQDGDGFDIASVQSDIALIASPGLAPEALSLSRGDGDGQAGKWDNTLPLLKYDGDWDCDKTAMLNLAHQYERRTGSLMALESRTIELDNPELSQTPFLFMTGHDPYEFEDAEVSNLGNYLNGGGYIWINDSTDLGNDKFDAAVRREMARVLPGAEWVKIPRSSNLFKGPYDLTNGYKGYAVPPGDKYRQDYHEGLVINGRLAVIYTRNDYGDGLEIDPRTHPLMSSLSGLSPQEMAEGSVRMGINIVSYFVNEGGLPNAKTRDSVAREQEAEGNKLAEYLALPSAPLPVPEPEQEWVYPEGWGDTIPVEVENRIIGTQTAVRMDFAKPGGGAVTRVEKVVLQSTLPLTLGRDKVLLMDMMSHLKGGARVALAFANGEDYFETAPVFIKPGLNPHVVFDFEDIRCKSANSDWAYTENFPATIETERWFILLYPQSGTGRIDIGNMRTAEK